MIIAVDLDGMLFAYPKFFQEFFASMQHHNKVGILTSRSADDKKTLIKVLDELDIHPDFFVARPEDLDVDNGIYKATVCNELKVDLLFDDFEYSDPQMLASFFSHNTHTIPFTSWAYDPDKPTYLTKVLYNKSRKK